MSFCCEPLRMWNWHKFEELFGPKGACAGCWCMFWRTESKASYLSGKGDGNREAMHALVCAEKPVGILLFAEGGGPALGWCSISPRGDLPGLTRSRVLEPLDAEPVWSITCLFVRKGDRNQGHSVRLLKAAVQFAMQKGARWVEGYPVVPHDRMPDLFAWTGTLAAYDKAGFKEAGRWSDARPIMRKHC
jgi:GNAT superfamily N-acetyltransferase